MGYLLAMSKDAWVSSSTEIKGEFPFLQQQREQQQQQQQQQWKIAIVWKVNLRGTHFSLNHDCKRRKYQKLILGSLYPCFWINVSWGAHRDVCSARLRCSKCRSRLAAIYLCSLTNLQRDLTDGIFSCWCFFTGKSSHLFWAMDREFPCGKRLKSWEWKTIFRRGMSFWAIGLWVSLLVEDRTCSTL